MNTCACGIYADVCMHLEARGHLDCVTRDSGTFHLVVRDRISPDQCYFASDCEVYMLLCEGKKTLEGRERKQRKVSQQSLSLGPPPSPSPSNPGVRSIRPQLAPC